LRKVFLDDLPKKEGWGATKGNQVIDWKNSVGFKVNFIYNDVKGEISIINYYSNGYVAIGYNKNTLYTYSGNFVKCKIGTLLREKHEDVNSEETCVTKKLFTEHLPSNFRGIDWDVCIGVSIPFIYNELVGEIEIIDYKKELATLTVKYGDLIKDIHSSNFIACKIGELVCKKQTIHKTHPHILKLLVDKKLGHTLTYGSDNLELFNCPRCRTKIKARVYDVVKYGLSCKKCSDGISIPNKFVYNVLEQTVGITNFECEKSNFNWIENNEFRYDNVLEFKKWVIENHGIQHYEDKNWKSVGGKTLEEIQESDKVKKKLAEINGYKYIEIDCRYSTLEWMKNSMLNSELSELDLSRVDWNKAWEYAMGTKVKETNDLWNDGYSTADIAKIMSMSQGTIIDYLTKGKGIGWSDYNKKESKVRGSKNGADKNFKTNNYLKCIELWEGEEMSVGEIRKETGISQTAICKYLKKAKDAGLVLTYSTNEAKQRGWKIGSEKQFNKEAYIKSIELWELNKLNVDEIALKINTSNVTIYKYLKIAKEEGLISTYNEQEIKNRRKTPRGKEHSNSVKIILLNTLE